MYNNIIVKCINEIINIYLSKNKSSVQPSVVSLDIDFVVISGKTSERYDLYALLYRFAVRQSFTILTFCSDGLRTVSRSEIDHPITVGTVRDVITILSLFRIHKRQDILFLRFYVDRRPCDLSRRLIYAHRTSDVNILIDGTLLQLLSRKHDTVLIMVYDAYRRTKIYTRFEYSKVSFRRY